MPEVGLHVVDQVLPVPCESSLLSSVEGTAAFVLSFLETFFAARTVAAVTGAGVGGVSNPVADDHC